MKRLISIIEQDCIIWNLSSKEAEQIFCAGILNKIKNLNTLDLTEDDLVDAWVLGFRQIVPTLNAELVLYKGINVNDDFIWMRNNPKSWITSSL